MRVLISAAILSVMTLGFEACESERSSLHISSAWSPEGRDITASRLTGEVTDVRVSPTGPSGEPGIHTRLEIQSGTVTRTVWMAGGTLGDRARVVAGRVAPSVGTLIRGRTNVVGETTWIALDPHSTGAVE